MEINVISGLITQIIICVIILSSILNVAFAISYAHDVQEYCRWENFNVTCGPDRVILMTSAKYGRMKRGRCLTEDVSIGCYGDVMLHADTRCSGRHDCVIRVPDEMLHEVQPCSKDFMAYLEASYTCLPVATGSGQNCKSYESVELDGAEGYIGNVVTEGTGYGTSFCPWKIKLAPGQRINITLYDFGVLRYNKESPLCQVYATIKEKTKHRDVTVCGGSRRMKLVLVTDSHEAVVTIVSHGGQQDKPYFLLKYTAVGCPDMKAPPGGWVKRDGESLTVGCDNTDSKYHLVCKENYWVGSYKNCTNGDSSEWDFTSAGAEAFPFGLLISVAIGVVLGILLGTLMLSFVLVYRRKKREEREADVYGKGGATVGPPHMYNDDRLYAPTFAKNFTGVGYDKSGSGGYSHIWESRKNITSQTDAASEDAQRPASKSRHVGSGQYPGNADLQGRPDLTRPHRDHVYESPKPARREEDLYNTGIVGDIPYYHEFDPNNSDHVTDDARKGEISRIRHGGVTDCTLSLHDD